MKGGVKSYALKALAVLVSTLPPIVSVNVPPGCGVGDAVGGAAVGAGVCVGIGDAVISGTAVTSLMGMSLSANAGNASVRFKADSIVVASMLMFALPMSFGRIPAHAQRTAAVSTTMMIVPRDTPRCS